MSVGMKMQELQLRFVRLSSYCFICIIFTCLISGVISFFCGGGIAASVIFLFGQVGALWLIVFGISRRFSIDDIRLLFGSVYAVYGGTLPVAVLLGYHNIYDAHLTNLGVENATWLYGCGLAGFNCACAIFPIKLVVGKNNYEIPCKLWAIKTAVVVGVFLFLGIYAYRIGYRFTGSINHEGAKLFYVQQWIVLTYFTQGLLMYYIMHKHEWPLLGRMLMWSMLFLFIAFIFSLGNRRDFMPIVLISIGVWVNRRAKKIDWKAITYFTLLGLLLLALGRIRYDTNIKDETIGDKLANTEFAYPVQTLVYYITKERPEYLWGETYTRLPLLIVPRAIWTGKPKSLGTQFILDAFGTEDYQGFAFTPNTEAFLNFGYVGPVIIMAIIGIVFTILIKVSISYPGIYFIVLSSIFDLNRGEVSTWLYQLIFILLGYGALYCLGICRYRMVS